MSFRTTLQRRRMMVVPILLVAAVASTNAQQVRFDPFAGSGQSAHTSSQPVDQKIIPHIELTDSDLDMALKMISDLTGWSIFTSDKARGKKVSLWATNIGPDAMLDRVVTLAGLLHVRKDNIVNVMTHEEYQQYYGVIKRVIRLKHGQAADVVQTVQPFLTPRGKLVPHPETNSVVLYEVEVNLPLIEEVIGQIDLPAERAVLEVIQLCHADARSLAKSLQEIFQPKTTAKPVQQPAVPRQGPGPSTRPEPEVSILLSAERTVQIHPVTATNHLVVRGYRDDVDLIKELVTRLDAPGATEVKNYQLKYVMAYEAYYNLYEFLRLPGSEQQDNAVIRLGMVEETNSIVLRAPAPVHRMVADFLKCIDIPLPEEAGGIRTYRLENADAQQVAKILSELIEREWEDREQRTGRRGGLPRGPGSITSPSRVGPGMGASGAGGAGAGGTSPGGLVRKPETRAPTGTEGTETPVVQRAERPQVSYSEQTNSVVIKASMREHEQFARVIKDLDRRPSQVLIETVVVEIRGTEDLDLGVELESFHLSDDGNLSHLIFTSFGLSTLDPTTGTRTLTPAPGGTAVVSRRNEVRAILHALQSSGKGNIRSAPSLLVNDNGTGLIQSIAEEPTAQVNASTTVATTTFAGFVQAGMQFAIKPHISDKDCVRVEYEITLNSFRGQATATLPPARDTSTVQSEATVPDGHSIIIGGLNAADKRKTVDKIPLLGDIPGLGELFKRTVTTETVSRFYVFMTPVILRDDAFVDLKRMSDRIRTQAGEEESYPKSPMMELPTLDPSEKDASVGSSYPLQQGPIGSGASS